MAFNRPTLEELVQRITVDLETSLGIVGARLRNSFTTLFGKVVAGAAHLLHGHLEYNAKQLFPDTAESEHLSRWASIWGLTRTAATFATGNVTFTGENGIEIPSDTELTSSDEIVFITTDSGTISGGTLILPVRCKSSGVSGNAEVNTVLTLVKPITSVDGEATVSSAITGGEDEETDEALLARLLDRIQEPPLGGKDTDYVKWAKEVDGVTRAWAYPLYVGVGTVGIFFVKDAEDPIFPDETAIDEVSAYIAERRPVTAAHFVFSPTADPVNFDIELVDEDTPAIRASIEEELRDLFERESQPGGTILISHMREAISVALDEYDHILYSPTANFTSASGYMPVVGDITWE